MFIFTEKSIGNKFIRSIKTGYFIQEEAIKVCEIKFSLANYDDLLFKKHSIQFPNALLSAVAKRRCEYLSGRIAAQTLLKRVQNHDNVIQSQMRTPIWPRGWVGSISHTDQYAIAILIPQNKRYTPGIDIVEFNPDAFEEIAEMFTNENERNLLIKNEIDYNLALHIVFSAKESLYKSIYPQVNKFLGFETSIVTNINIKNQTITLQLVNTLTANLPAGYLHTAYYQIDKNKVVTLIY